MRITKMVVAAGLLAVGLSLGGCYNDRPGHWGGHHHHHHHGHDHDHDHDRDGYSR
ncbi:hypothetical protein K7G81_00805 [Hephaestia sp. CMS5P-6]|nr:hypothetical protein [Hephaestia mangrovi]